MAVDIRTRTPRRNATFADHRELQHRKRTGSADRMPMQKIMNLLPTLPFWPEPTHGGRGTRLRGATRILSWLQTMPGDGWQDRWQNSGADYGTEWIDQLVADDPRPCGPQHVRDELRTALTCLLALRVILPSYTFLTAYGAVNLFKIIRSAVSPEAFARVEQAGLRRGMEGRQLAEALTLLTKVVLHTGKDLPDLTPDDLFEVRAWQLGHAGRMTQGVHGAWELLVDIGVLPERTTMRSALRQGQRPTAELVDRYQIKNKPIRDLLIRYLDERRPGMDYSSFRTFVCTLASTFWADIEQHNPEVRSLDLPEDVVVAWKERLHHVVKADGSKRVRKSRLAVLTHVRSFYLDLQEWALEDPSWAPWAVPSPVRKGDTDGMAKERRATTAEMHQRIRDRLPHLQALVEAAERHRQDQADLLAKATATEVGDTFDHDATLYRRIVYKSFARGGTQRGRPTILVQHRVTGEQTDLTQAEDEAFWAWAIIEVLRHTGVRIEELLEITHLALISYKLPGTGEIVPLLQIVPSKSNEERLLLVTPELASSLATVIARIRAIHGTVPLVSRYDGQEAVTGPPLPHLFQRAQGGWRQEVISPRVVQKLLNHTLQRTGLLDRAGQPLRFTPHDFRRMFVTDAVTGGLPVHIAARLLGHKNLTTTQAYLAVFQDDLIRTYRAFVDERRAMRPTTEYREPTQEEWREFQQHFELRKVELGTCGRPYGTPCNHEHACFSELTCGSSRSEVGLASVSTDLVLRHEVLELISNDCSKLFAEFGGDVVEFGIVGVHPILGELEHPFASESLDTDQHIYRPVDALAPRPLLVELLKLVVCASHHVFGSFAHQFDPVQEGEVGVPAFFEQARPFLS
ncbi:tyrosine-type recombinase/integrase [Actinomadura sp. 3N508]|uniref:tyrosine-type recombinase/integrase n=1 Tax=Actinomadura sp. 3N508 TaxID=3375153 RepID=UPI0037AB0C86